MTKKILPLTSMENLLKKRSSAGRVGDDAKEALRDVLEDVAERIGDRALKLAQHSGRKTIKAADIKLAANNI